MAMKRANGTGTVYKMKHKALRKPYRAVVTLGYNSEGKPLRKSIGTFATQKKHIMLLPYSLLIRKSRRSAKLLLGSASIGVWKKLNAKGYLKGELKACTLCENW